MISAKLPGLQRVRYQERPLIHHSSTNNKILVDCKMNRRSKFCYVELGIVTISCNLQLCSRNQLLRTKTIRGFFAGILLVLFGLSITPKIALHDLIVSHKDSSSISIGGEAQLKIAGYHCDVDNLVVQVPFLVESISVTFNTPSSFATYQSKPTHNFCSSDNIVSCLRGPPSFS
jgi:hypothetical protein